MTSAPPDTVPRFGLLVVTHGGLAFELVKALDRIVGGSDHVRALSIDWDSDLAAARAALEKALAEVDPGGGVLILTDMFGGTATNLTLSFLRSGIEIVTGVNLPMMIKFSNLAGSLPLRDAAARIMEQGRRSIALATDYLGPAREGSGKAP
jgi:PTS system mannose-specific IIA component